MERGKILIVEDEVITGKDLKLILERNGYTVTGPARSGEKAIALAEQDQPDLVLMDIQLSSAMDGIEAARRIKERLGVPVVYLTAHSNGELIERAKSTEPFGYLVKPYSPTQVCTTLEMALFQSRMEKKLVESEERLDLALKGTNAGLWDWYVQTGKIAFNDRWAEILGYTLNELEPVSIQTWMDLCHSDDLKKSREQLEKHFAGETDFYRCEFRMKHKNGLWIWVLDRGRVVSWDKDNKPVRMIGTHVDITENKHYETLLQAERDMAAAWSSATTFNERLEACLRMAIQISDMDCGGLYLVDKTDSSLVLAVHRGLSSSFVGNVSCHFADSAHAQLVQKGVPVYAEIEDLPETIKDVFAEEGLKSLAIIPVLSQDRVIACLNVGAHTLDHVPDHARRALERIARYAGSFVEQELQAEEIRQSRQDLNTLFDTVYDMIFILDGEGNIIHCNRMVCEKLGYPKSELSGKHVLYVHPEDRHKEVESVLAAILTGQTKVCFIPFKTRDGLLIPVETRVHLGQWKGREVIFGVSRDITERLALERRTAQVEKAESLNRMAGAVAHHFNNMLFGVIGNLELVQNDLPPGNEMAENIREAMGSAQRAAEMSRLMLTYTGLSSQNLKVLALSEICDPMIPKLLSMMPGHVRLLVDFPAPGPVVKADVGQIGQVFVHLVNNAWEAVGDKNGEIRAFIRTLKVEDIPRESFWPADWKPTAAHYAALGVSDTGCGISSQDMGNLMDPFFSTKFTGRGMGLAVVLSIVKRHGGAITVESKPDVGSLFQVFLPIVDQNIAPAIRKDVVRAAPVKTGLRILLVEDEEVIRGVVGTMLKRLGYEVVMARDGVEAVEIFKAEKDAISLVISNLSMPRMNGWESLAAFRKMRPHIPVILASGYDEVRIMAEAHVEQPQMFLQKPYGLTDLKNALEKTLGPPSMEGSQ